MTRTTTLGASLAAALLLATAGIAGAVVQPDHLVGQPALEVAGGNPARAERSVSWSRVPPRALRAWTGFLTAAGGSWQAMWDVDTGIPTRIFGRGIAAPGAVKSEDAAAQHARAFLAAHVELLAPGSRLSDFVLVSNHLDAGGMRTVGFFQYSQGLRVLGGQVSFRFKNDRLFVIGSEALPQVQSRLPDAPLPELTARGVASAWILSDMAASARDLDYDGPFILPIVSSGAVSYRTVVRVTVDARQPIGRWDVYLDAASGAPVAREQTLRFATGSVHYNVPLRHPNAERADLPAAGASLVIDGTTITSDGDGVATWAGTAAGALTARARGPLVRVINDAGSENTYMTTLQPDGTAVWNVADQPNIDSQLATFIHGAIVKEYARSFAPDLGFLDAELRATVNINDSCNAFSDGETINFFQASQQCANTGQLADVIYHEFGHSLHAQSIIQGVGAFDGAFSEGLSDYLAATIVDDPGMGRGFFHDNTALRHMDPTDKEHIWPDDVAEIHYTGIIFAGAMWDLRKLLVERHGYADGVAQADRMFYAAVQRAADIPSTYVEVLAADDDNGDLSDGTPNFCDINAAFGAHGLRAVSVEVSPLAVEPPSADGHHVSLRVEGLSDQCAGDAVSEVTVAWRQRDLSDSGDFSMIETAGTYEGDIPQQPEGSVVNYQVMVQFSDGAKRVFPDNAADPWYEFFVGEVVELYCNDFEGTDPFADGWTHGLDQGETSEGADDWMWGEPVGAGGDPRAAWSGSRAIGNDLGGGQFNGTYQADKINHALSPAIDVGKYSDVRIQYWRWLNVEDAYFDQGSVYVNGQPAWQNANSDQGNSSSVHHSDKEWRFHDIPASSYVSDGTVQVKFEIASDGGLEMGGWTIDDFCIVAFSNSVCGDGAVTGAETCDDGEGNSDGDPDACRESCQLPTCGDGVVDSGEQCDDGDGDDGNECSNACTPGPGFDDGGGSCGCRSTDTGAGLGMLLMLGLLGLVSRRTLRIRR